VLSCYVGAANQADVEAAPAVLVPGLETYASIQKILADQGYRGDECRGASKQLLGVYWNSQTSSNKDS
jgi:hypothetical protein